METITDPLFPLLTVTASTNSNPFFSRHSYPSQIIKQYILECTLSFNSSSKTSSICSTHRTSQSCIPPITELAKYKPFKTVFCSSSTLYMAVRSGKASEGWLNLILFILWHFGGWTSVMDGLCGCVWITFTSHSPRTHTL